MLRIKGRRDGEAGQDTGAGGQELVVWDIKVEVQEEDRAGPPILLGCPQ